MSAGKYLGLHLQYSLLFHFNLDQNTLRGSSNLPNIKFWEQLFNYKARPECKDTKVLNVYNIFNLQKRNELPVHNFIFQQSRQHCPNIY